MAALTIVRCTLLAFIVFYLAIATTATIGENKHSRISSPIPSPAPSILPRNPFDDLRALPYPSPPLPSLVYVYDTDGMTAPDVFLLLSLQGALARLNLLRSPTSASVPLLYHVAGTNQTSPEFIYWSEYQKLIPTVNFSASFIKSPAADLVTQLSSHITGAYQTTLDTDSVNICISLAPLTPGTICCTADHISLLKKLNIPIIKDLSPMNESDFIDEYIGGTGKSEWPFSTRFISAQLPSKAVTSLSDWTMLIGAVQIHQTDTYQRLLQYLHASHPNTPLFNAVFGWITDGSTEHDYTGNASRWDAGVLASDWLNNGATHSSLQSAIPKPINPTKSNPIRLVNNTGKHTAAFVFTDGDNICSDMNLLLDKAHWAHPKRGSIPIGWGLNPSLALTSPIGLNVYYREAVAANDGFVAFSAQYAFPEAMTEEGRQEWAELSAQAMAAADMRVMNFIGNSFNESYFAPLLTQWNIDGAIYFDYYGNYVLPSPANGSVKWVNGKPCIAVRQSLWQDHTTPASIAAMLNKQSRDHTTSDGYSVIAVHIWSETVDSLIEVAEALAEDVILVKPDELVMLMTRNVRPN